MSSGPISSGTRDPGHVYNSIHGYYMRDGQWSKLARATRTVHERDARGFPVRVGITGQDESGRRFDAEGRCLNHIALHLNPNLFTVNSLTAWELDGVACFGEDHDNWSAPGARRFFRAHARA